MDHKSYIYQLEQQNEQLRQLLIKSELYHEWRDIRNVMRLRYMYSIQYSYVNKESTFFTSDEMFVSQKIMKDMFRNLKYVGFSYFEKAYERFLPIETRHIDEVTLRVISYRNTPLDFKDIKTVLRVHNKHFVFSGLISKNTA